MRVRAACDLCRARKVRCDGRLPCRLCQDLGSGCAYAPAERGGNASSALETSRPARPGPSSTSPCLVYGGHEPGCLQGKDGNDVGLRDSEGAFQPSDFGDSRPWVEIGAGSCELEHLLRGEFSSVPEAGDHGNIEILALQNQIGGDVDMTAGFFGFDVNTHSAASTHAAFFPLENGDSQILPWSPGTYHESTELQPPRPYQDIASPGSWWSSNPSRLGSLDVQQCVGHYFAKFHPLWPVVHRGTFDLKTESQHLVDSIVMIGAWESGVPSWMSIAAAVRPTLVDVLCSKSVSLHSHTGVYPPYKMNLTPFPECV